MTHDAPTNSPFALASPRRRSCSAAPLLGTRVTEPSSASMTRPRHRPPERPHTSVSRGCLSDFVSHPHATRPALATRSISDPRRTLREVAGAVAQMRTVSCHSATAYTLQVIQELSCAAPGAAGKRSSSSAAPAGWCRLPLCRCCLLLVVKDSGRT